MKDFLRHNGILILIIAVLLAAITAVASYALKDVYKRQAPCGGYHRYKREKFHLLLPKVYF